MRTHSTELGHRANIVKFNIYKPSPAEWPDSAQTVRRGPFISLSQVFFAPTGAQGVMMWTFNHHHSGSRLSIRLSSPKAVCKWLTSGIYAFTLYIYIWCFYEKKTRKIKGKNIPKFLTVAQLNSNDSYFRDKWEAGNQVRVTQTSFLFSAAARGVVSPTSGLSLSLCLDPNLIPALRRLKLPSEHSEEVVSVSKNDTVFFLSETLFMLRSKQVDCEKKQICVLQPPHCCWIYHLSGLGWTQFLCFSLYRSHLKIYHFFL